MKIADTLASGYVFVAAYLVNMMEQFNVIYTIILAVLAIVLGVLKSVHYLAKIKNEKLNNEILQKELDIVNKPKI